MRKFLLRVFVRHIQRGEMFPRGYGIAWRSWAREDATAVLIPFNVLCGLARWLYFATLHGFPRHWNDEHFHPRRHDQCVCSRCGRTMQSTKAERAGVWQ